MMILYLLWLRLFLKKLKKIFLITSYPYLCIMKLKFTVSMKLFFPWLARISPSWRDFVNRVSASKAEKVKQRFLLISDSLTWSETITKLQH